MTSPGTHPPPTLDDVPGPDGGLPVDAGDAAGRRALGNTVLRAAGELSGKVATLVLFAFLARELDQAAVGTFVFAFAFVQIAMILVDLGFDRLVVRRVALDPGSMRRLLANVLVVKLTLAVPVTLLVVAIAEIGGYDETTRLAIYALVAGLLADSLARTVHSVMNARERGGLLSVSVVVQRVTGAALGIAALLAGFGVVAVCLGYVVGALVGLAIALLLLVRHLGGVDLAVDVATWPGLMRESLPFALHYALSFVLTKADALILAAVGTQAAVGLYGAASRLYEASFFVTYSLTASFVAMYTYLDRDTAPTIGSVYERSIKIGLTALVPISVAYIVVGEPLCVALFGEGFRESARTLQLLAPSVALMGVVNLSASLISLRAGPRAIVPLSAGILGLNLALNAVLASSYQAEGAGAAMSISLATFAVIAVWRAGKEVGGVDVGRTLAAPLLAGAVMAIVAELIGAPVLALIAGLLGFALTYVAIERIVAPDDLRFLWQLILRRPRAAATP